MVSVGLIGIGRFGRRYLETLESMGAAVGYICSRTKKPDLASLKHSTDVNEVLASDVDCVIVATPAHTHYEIVKKALLVDKHVLVEKPFVVQSTHARELVALALERKLVLMVAHIHCYNPGIVRIKKDIDSGLFGRILYMNSAGGGAGPIREDTSVIFDILSHDLSIFDYLLNRKIDRIHTIGGKDFASVCLRLGDTIASSRVSWLYPVKKRDLLVVGEKQSCIYDDVSKTLMYLPDKTISLEKITPLQAQLEHFFDCLKSGEEPLTSGGKCVHIIEQLEACEKSIVEGLL